MNPNKYPVYNEGALQAKNDGWARLMKREGYCWFKKGYGSPWRREWIYVTNKNYIIRRISKREFWLSTASFYDAIDKINPNTWHGPYESVKAAKAIATLHMTAEVK